MKGQLVLVLGDTCPKCQLGKGLRKAYPIEFGLTGWDNYKFLHCDICGAVFVGKDSVFEYAPGIKAPFSS